MRRHLELKINYHDGDGKTALIWAADRSRAEVMKVLSAEVQPTPNWGVLFGNNTTLIHACHKGNKRIMKKLLRKPEIDVMFANSYGWTALHVATGHSAECLRLLATIPQLDWNKKDCDGGILLFVGLYEGNASAVETIIAQENVDYRFKSNGGWSYAEACVKWDNGKSVRCLQLMTGVSSMDWNSKLTRRFCDRGGEPPLIYLLKRNKLEKFKVLVKCPYVDFTCCDINGDGLEKIAR